MSKTTDKHKGIAYNKQKKSKWKAEQRENILPSKAVVCLLYFSHIRSSDVDIH